MGSVLMLVLAQWSTTGVADAGITFELPVAVQAIAGADFTRAENAIVHAGNTFTLAWWRSQFGERKLTFSAETKLEVCGRPAVRQEVRVPDEVSTGQVIDANGKPSRIERRAKSRVVIAIAVRTVGSRG